MSKEHYINANKLILMRFTPTQIAILSIIGANFLPLDIEWTDNDLLMYGKRNGIVFITEETIINLNEKLIGCEYAIREDGIYYYKNNFINEFFCEV